MLVGGGFVLVGLWYLLGQIPDVRADNEWHHAEWDLLAARPEKGEVRPPRLILFFRPPRTGWIHPGCASVMVCRMVII